MMKEIVFTSSADGKEYSPEEIVRNFNGYENANSQGFRVVKVLGKYLSNFKKLWRLAFDKEIRDKKKNLNKIEEQIKQEKTAITQMDLARDIYGKETKAGKLMEDEISASLRKIYNLQYKEALLRVALQKENIYLGKANGLKDALEHHRGTDKGIDKEQEEMTKVPDFKQQEEDDIKALHRELDEIFAQSQKVESKEQDQQPIFNVKTKTEEESKTKVGEQEEIAKSKEQEEIEQKQRELLTSEARMEQEKIDEHSLDDVFLDLTKNMQELGNLISNVKSEVENQKSIAENEAREKVKLQKELDEMKALGQSKEQLDKRYNELDTREKEVTTKEENITNQTNELNNRENRLNERENDLNERERSILNREKEFLGKISEFSSMVKNVNENLKTQTNVKELVRK